MAKKFFIIKSVTFNNVTNNPINVEVVVYSSLERAKMDFLENLRVLREETFGLDDVVFEYEESNEFVYHKRGLKILTKIEEVDRKFFE